MIRSTESGTDFQVVAVVTNVNQAVNEGSDGVEHMYQHSYIFPFSITDLSRYCGHKDRGIVNDGRNYGFPFDRQIDFDLKRIPEDRT